MKNYQLVLVNHRDLWIKSNLLGNIVRPWDIKGLIEMHKDHKVFFNQF